MKKLFYHALLFLMIFLGTAAMKSDKPAYQFFDAQGKKADYKDVVKAALESDVVFFGEQHNNPIDHWLQLELSKALIGERQGMVVMGAEMFETDNQLLLDEYLGGRIKKNNFKEEARLWKNYNTDYEPLVELAKSNGIPFIATNIPRRYAAVVNKSGFEGLDSLSDEARAYIAPLPIAYDPELKGYKDMLEMMGGQGGHASANLPKAQAAKDATMAHFISRNWLAGKIFIHFNGTYHSDNFQGILWYLKRERPQLRILTISSVEQPDIDELSEEGAGLADFILCTPESMTKTN